MRWFGKGGHGRILGVKLGYNPNSSSLGVDVTFLLFGMAAITVLTPVLGLLLRLFSLGRRRLPAASAAEPIDPAPTPD
jgi:hypothetical protein